MTAWIMVTPQTHYDTMYIGIRVASRVDKWAWEKEYDVDHSQGMQKTHYTTLIQL